MLTALAACGPGPLPGLDGAPPPDAGADAMPPQVCRYEPIAVVGSSPAGDLGDLDTALAKYAFAWCGEYIDLRIARSDSRGDFEAGLWVDIYAMIGHDVEFPIAGTFPASVLHRTAPATYTDQARFLAERIDDYDANGGRIVGRLLVSDPAWELDLAVDVPFCGVYSCE